MKRLTSRPEAKPVKVIVTRTEILNELSVTFIGGPKHGSRLSITCGSVGQASAIEFLIKSVLVGTKVWVE